MKGLSLAFRLTALPLLIAGALCMQERQAMAVGTRSFRLDTLEELRGGDLQGTSVDSLGRVRAGLVLGKTPVSDATSVWSSLVLPDGSVLIGTGNSGKVYRIANGQVSEYGDTGQMAVTALALDGKGAVVAGTIPNGKLFHLDGPGKVTAWVSLPGTEHIWALTLDPKSKALFAATGPDGKLFRIDQAGSAQVYFDSDEPHLMSVAIGPTGAVFTGSSGNAILYRLDAPGRATVVHDFPGTEVKAIAFGRDGRMFVVSNEYGTPPAIPRATGGSSTKAAGPTRVTNAQAGKGRLTRFDTNGRAEELLYNRETHYQTLALGDDGLPYVGTGDEGQVYTVDDAHTAILMADTEERQVGALVLAGRTRYVVTSDPVVYHEVKGVGGADAVWTSKVLDTGLRAQFGLLNWRVSGAVELASRTGNTEKPDGTWSAWSTAMTAPGKITSPAGRYLQVRARFARDPAAIVREVSVHFVTDNARAVVTSVSADSKGAAASSSGELPSSGSEMPEPSSKVSVSWKVDNPDNDKLRYRLFFRFENSTVWRPMLAAEEVLTKTSYDWDTSGLPEGLYRVRVEASDELANPPQAVLRHALESGTVLVDNTPPVFAQLQVAGRHIKGKVTDGLGPIARLDVSIDPQPKQWIPFYAQDGIFDEPSEEFDLDVGPLVTATPKIVALRAVDAAGNVVVKSVEVR